MYRTTTSPRYADKVSRQWLLSKFEGSADKFENTTAMRFTPCLVHWTSSSAQMPIPLLITANENEGACPRVKSRPDVASRGLTSPDVAWRERLQRVREMKERDVLGPENYPHKDFMQTSYKNCFWIRCNVECVIRVTCCLERICVDQWHWSVAQLF